MRILVRKQKAHYPWNQTCLVRPICLVPPILRRNRERKYGDTFLPQLLCLSLGRDAPYAALWCFLVVDPARFLGKALADILAVRKDVIDDARDIDLLGLAGLNR